MQQGSSFETIIKNGYIKVPERYSQYFDKKVWVEIHDDGDNAEKRNFGHIVLKNSYGNAAGF